jgi:hypothetical protein
MGTENFKMALKSMLIDTCTGTICPSCPLTQVVMDDERGEFDICDLMNMIINVSEQES